MRTASRFVVAVLLSTAFASSALALERVVTYHSKPLLSDERANEICKTFKPAADRKGRILRFICTRKLLYVCNLEDAVLSSDPQAGAKCFVERARNYD